MPSSRISRCTYDFCPMRLREDPLPSRKQGGPLDGQVGPTRLNQPPEAGQDVTVDQQASCGFSSAQAQRRIIPIQSVGLYGGLSCLHSSVASQLALVRIVVTAWQGGAAGAGDVPRALAALTLVM
jgi:hypothetical protein